MSHSRTQSDVAQPERGLWRGGYSGWDMTANWLLAGAASVAAMAAAVEMNRRNPAAAPAPLQMAVVAAALLWAGFGVLLLLRKLYYSYELTDQRLIHREGILFRRTFRLELIDIDDISHYQGPLQRLAGVGAIRIDSSDRSHPALILRGIQHVEQVADLIDQARRDQRQRLGLFVESI